MAKKKSKSKSKSKKKSNGFLRKSITIVYILFILAIGGFFIFQNQASEAKMKKKTVNLSSVKTVSFDKESEYEPVDLPKTLEPVYSYKIIGKSQSPRINFGEKTTLALKIRNTGNTTWNSTGGGNISLGPNRPEDRATPFFKEGSKGWIASTRIAMDKKTVSPGQIATFVFDVIAPQKSGVYREFFSPVVEGLKWVDQGDISWDIEVRNPANPGESLVTTVSGQPVKFIKVSLSNQRLYAYENGAPKYTYITSTGLAGMDTPKGEFKIYNKYSTAYSAPYDLYMDNWMAFTPSGSHGIHSLPYWLLRGGGKLYEGEEHLGTPVSHGCIRVGKEESKILYDWAEIGTPVYVSD